MGADQPTQGQKTSVMAMGANVSNTGGGEEDPPETGFEQIGATFYDVILVAIIL